MIALAWTIVGAAIALFLYAYVGYPSLLRFLLRRGGRRDLLPQDPEEWPRVSVSLPVYNEAAQVEGTLESLLALDYPRERLQVVVVSDASDDGTDEVVARYADQGIQLVRLARRGGKTAAERAAQPQLTGEFVLNIDASSRLAPGALRKLVRAATREGVGVAAGKAVSVVAGQESNAGEGEYMDYEMRIRDLETRTGGIIGASGCLYLIRRELHDVLLPDSMSRDFASALNAREAGYAAVSVPDAVCFIPRTPDLDREYRRKVRTLARGMRTLLHKRQLLNPFRFGLFSVKLWSHKVSRWFFPWIGLSSLPALLFLALEGSPTARILTLFAGIGFLFGGCAWAWGRRRPLPRALAIPAYLIMSNVAAVHASIRALQGRQQAVWEPTRREALIS